MVHNEKWGEKKGMGEIGDVTKCFTETQSKIPNSKQCRCKSTVARKDSLGRQEPRKNPREEPGSRFPSRRHYS